MKTTPVNKATNEERDTVMETIHDLAKKIVQVEAEQERLEADLADAKSRLLDLEEAALLSGKPSKGLKDMRDHVAERGQRRDMLGNLVKRLHRKLADAQDEAVAEAQKDRDAILEQINGYVSQVEAEALQHLAPAVVALSKIILPPRKESKDHDLIALARRGDWGVPCDWAVAFRKVLLKDPKATADRIGEALNGSRWEKMVSHLLELRAERKQFEAKIESLRTAGQKALNEARQKAA